MQQNQTLKLITQFASLLSSVAHKRGHSGTKMKIFLSVKNIKSTADAGKRRSSILARVRCNAQFATVSSCARRFFNHFNFQILTNDALSDEFLSRKILRVVL